ncbi:MAG: IPExxxVDY family protein [Bacteroidales bacterium]
MHRLTGAGPDNYRLLGISSHENDYRLSWAINNRLGLNFRKSENITVTDNKGGKLEFSLFRSPANGKTAGINLISNRCPDGFLIREMKNIDYFLQVFEDPTSGNIESIAINLKSIDIVSAVFEIPGKNFKKSWCLPPE